ncbi:ER membrane protein DP1/Yop1 [Phlyctochytrium planicorne]|nr:ER membrane protein DP1/Yop1 [Phlyctochytrium planicorne]
MTEKEGHHPTPKPAAAAAAAPTASPATFSALKKTALTHYENVDKALGAVPPLVELETYTRIHRIRLLVYALAGFLYLILIFNNLGGNILTHALGFFYPAMESIKAADKASKEDCQQWITFWIVLGALELLEYSDQALLSMLPYYFFFKVLFLLWLMLPQFKGAYRIWINGLQYIAKAPAPAKPVDPKKDGHEKKEHHDEAGSSKSTKKGWEYQPLSRIAR